MPANGDLSGSLYRAVAVTSSGRVALAALNNLVVVGVIAEDPGTTAAGDDILIHDIAAGGIGLVIANENISAGEIVHPVTGSGAAEWGRVGGSNGISGLAADQMGIGIALEDASAAGEIIRFLAMPVFGPHSA